MKELFAKLKQPESGVTQFPVMPATAVDNGWSAVHPPQQQRKETAELIEQIGSDGLTWIKANCNDSSRRLDHELLPKQKNFVAFDFFISGKQPKWYRFKVTVSPKQSDDSWHPIATDVIVPSGGVPNAIYSVSRPVFPTKTQAVYETETAPFIPTPSAPPIPLKD